MSPRDIFHAALAIADPAQRAAHLEQACAGNAALLNHIAGLLQVEGQLGSFLECTPVDSIGLAAEPVREAPGMLVGPYKLLQQIGEGGFGVVFMAEQQQPIRRKVALKVLKPGMDTGQVVARFEAERQALALMDHVNIARVFDAGSTSGEPGGISPGRPYFVMELVHGIPITEFCDQNHLAVRQRLELFATVCEAVQHAHQKGIIHRDLKPTNVMVTMHDDKPVAKVIDFGIAKATGQQLTDKTLFTNFAQMIGTPLYMSPEQAQMSGLDVDTRTDIYALGVLLYELLTGTTPIEQKRFKTAAYDEIRRIIREEDAPRPSTRLSTTDELQSIAANRSLEPKKLSGLVRGELDWIVMKSLEKDRNRRYETASALAADVERYLRDEPVQACPPSPWYRFRKFARRHKAALATAAALGLGLLSAVAILAVSNTRIGRSLAAETQAKEELKEAVARELGNFYQYALGLARRDWLACEIDQAQENLQACPPALRDGEWRHLHRVCHAELARFKHGENAGRLQYSPDGKTIANVGSGFLAALTLRDADTGQEQFTSLMIAIVDSALAYSPDGKQLVWAGICRRRFFALDPTIKKQPDSFAVSVWDVVQRNQVAGFNREGLSLGRVLLSPDASRVALVDSKSALICDAGTGRELFSLAGPIADIQVGPVFHSSGQILASYGSDRALRFWDGASGKRTRSVNVRANGVRMLVFSPDGRCLIGATYDDFRGPDALQVWEVPTGRDIAALRGHTGQVSNLAFSADGRRLASAGSDKTIIIWDLERGRELFTFRGHTGAILGLAFSPNGQRLASSSSDGTLRIWDASSGDDSAGPNDTESKR